MSSMNRGVEMQRLVISDSPPPIARCQSQLLQSRQTEKVPQPAVDM